MFNTRGTLETIVVAGGLRQIKDELNAYPLYSRMVRLFRFREIGLIALNEQRRETGRYASHHAPDGRITEIMTYFTSPSIAVKAPEKYLMEILHNAEWVKEHPLLAIGRYAPRFSLHVGKYNSVAEYVLVLLRSFISASP